MSFDESKAREIANSFCKNTDELSLVSSFLMVCKFLEEFPDELSWRTSKKNPKPSVSDEAGLKVLANRYFDAYRRSDFPVKPSTIPDEMVSVILKDAYGYSDEDCTRIKLEHQHAMCAENCVGNLLERYLDSKLRNSCWSWCCGEFVKAVDFIGKNESGEWLALQIKNRDNSENSSSSAIRDGTKIQKWFRSFSKDTARGRSSFTNWDNLPPLMQGYDLGEEDFKEFVSSYLLQEKLKLN
ncbi:SinI family restriction endonuclease [Vibrio cholerae]|nr:SinI family restriction endonuclease [Vibrio cholerae]